MSIWTIADIQQQLGVGRRTAERYAKESGALLPRVKGGPYKVSKKAFVEWFAKGGTKR